MSLTSQHGAALFVGALIMSLTSQHGAALFVGALIMSLTSQHGAALFVGASIMSLTSQHGAALFFGAVMMSDRDVTTWWSCLSLGAIKMTLTSHLDRDQLLEFFFLLVPKVEFIRFLNI